MTSSSATDRERLLRLFEAIAAATPDFLYAFDLEGRFLYANKRLLEVWGRTAEQAIGKNLYELGYPQWHADMHVRELRQVIETRQPIKGEVPFTGGSGISGVYEYIFSPVIGADGGVEMVIGTTRDVTEQAAGRQRLAEQEQWLRAVLEATPECVKLVGPEGELLFMNPSGLCMIESEGEAGADAVRGRSVFDLVAPEHREQWREMHRRVCAGEKVAWEFDIIGLHGTRRSMETHAVPMPLADGRTGQLAVTRDVTRRKDAERAQAHLAAVVASSDDAIVSKTLQGVIRTWNGGAERLFGYTAEEVVGRSIEILFPPDRLDEEPEILRRIRAGERVDHFETIRRRKDGTMVDVSVTISPIRDAQGQIIGASKIARDISGRKQAEAREREEWSVVETINRVGRAVAAELDLARLVQLVTDATTELTGAEFGAFFYNVINERGESYVLYTLSGVDRSKFEQFPMPRNTQIFGPTFKGEGVVRIDDVTRDPRYGKNPPYHGMPKGHLPVRSYLAAPVISRSGEVLGGLFFGHARAGVFSERHERIAAGVAAPAAVAIDNARLFEAAQRAGAEKDQLLASERSARAELERAGRIKDEFLATLSHELRTPLNAILGWAQVLAKEAVDPSLNEGVQIILRNARVQAQIIEDLLDMSRIVSGKIRLDVQRVSLTDVVEQAVRSVKPTADAKGVRLQMVLDPLAGPISGDSSRLQQVFWNLLTNALKFTPKGGRVQVVLERVNSHLEVSVIDTGEGIAAEFLPHVFDRFRQADGGTTRRHGGLGLGLAIVKQLVELHGGTVRVKSGGVGAGSTFTVTLPVIVIHPEPAERDGATASERRHPAIGGVPLSVDTCAQVDGVRVLVVDDEADARALVRRLLEDCRAIVSTASSAAEAIALLRAERPDVLVSDIGMPDEDGYSLMRQVRRLPPGEGGSTPAIALTAYARAEDRMNAIMAGFQHHVVKPVEPAELITLVAVLSGAAGRG